MSVKDVNLREVNVFSKLEGMWMFFNQTLGEVSAICSNLFVYNVIRGCILQTGERKAMM